MLEYLLGGAAKQDGKRDFAPHALEWWSKPFKELCASTFNARAEIVESKPFFSDAFKRTRCLTLMSGLLRVAGYHERNQPWYVTAATDPRGGGAFG